MRSRLNSNFDTCRGPSGSGGRVGGAAVRVIRTVPGSAGSSRFQVPSSKSETQPLLVFYLELGTWNLELAETLPALPQAYSIPGRKTIHGDFAPRRRESPACSSSATASSIRVAVGQEVDALVGRADPPALGVGLVAIVRAVHEDVRECDQLRDLGFRPVPQFLDRVAAEDHHRQAQFPGDPRERDAARGVGERLAAQQRDPLDRRFLPGVAESQSAISSTATSSARP